MADGTYASYPGYTKTSVDIVSPKICHHAYLTNNPEFSSINGIIYYMIQIPCLVIIVLSCPCDEVLLWEWLLGEDRAQRWTKRALSATHALGAALNNFAVVETWCC